MAAGTLTLRDAFVGRSSSARTLAAIVGGAGLIAANFGTAHSQPYPDKNITLIINTGVGGTGDIIPRVLGE